MNLLVNGFRINVLTSKAGLVAGFVSPIEACRYAALVYEPGAEVVLRRVADGAEMRFTPACPTASVASWLDAPQAAAAPPRSQS